MDILKKYSLIKKLILTEEDAILKQIEETLFVSSNFFGSDLNPALKESIDRGVAQAEKGEGIAHSEIMQAYRQRLTP